MVTVGNSEEFCGGGTLFLKAFLPPVPFGSRCSSLQRKVWQSMAWKEAVITVKSNVTFPNALRVWEVPGGTAVLLQMEGAENPGSAGAVYGVVSST